MGIIFDMVYNEQLFMISTDFCIARVLKRGAEPFFRFAVGSRKEMEVHLLSLPPLQHFYRATEVLNAKTP